jgi:hypothetical protein
MDSAHYTHDLPSVRSDPTRRHLSGRPSASGIAAFLKIKFDGTKLPVVVCPSPDHNRWCKIPLKPQRPFRNRPRGEPGAAEQRLMPRTSIVGMRQSSPEVSVPLQVPLPAHRLFARFVALGVQQEPHAAARRSRARSCIVAREASIEIVSPADVGPIAVGADAAENVDEASR